jgi:hypothetical protein
VFISSIYRNFALIKNINLIRIVKILIFVAYSTQAWTQLPAEEPIDYIYRSHWNLGPRMATNGFGFEFNYERRINEKLRHGIHFSVNQLKSHKETRITNPFYEDSKSYIFGKINQVFSAHLAYSFSKLLYDQIRPKGISIRFNQSIGMSTAFLKPIYVKIKEPFIDDALIKPKDEKYNPSIHTEEFVYGRSSFGLGLSDITSQIGMYSKTGVQFDFNPNKSRISAVEIGVQFEIFPRKIQIFYLGRNQQFHPALYAAVQFGKNRL